MKYILDRTLLYCDFYTEHQFQLRDFKGKLIGTEAYHMNNPYKHSIANPNNYISLWNIFHDRAV